MTNRARDWERVQDSIQEMVRRIAAQFRPDKIILFGSHVRGDAHPDSDVDWLVVMPVQGSKRQKATEIDMALADRTVSLDLLVVTPEDFERGRAELALSCDRPRWRGRCSMTEPRDQPRLT